MSNQHLLTLAASISTNTPLILWGPPGIGKTATIEALAKAMNVHLEVVIASIREPADFSGLPVIDQGDGSVARVSMAPPSWATRLVDAVNRAKEAITPLPGQKSILGILFLDELTTAPPAVQAALLRVVLDRVVGDLSLPEEVAIVAGANPSEQAAGGWDLSLPLSNRFAHIDWPVPTIGDWTEALIQGWPMPQLPRIGDWQKELPLAKGLVSAYLHKSRSGLHSIPKDAAQQGRAWPSPRTWEMATHMLAAGLSSDARKDEGAMAQLVGSCVSLALGIEFGALIKGDDLPDPVELIKKWDTIKLPKRADKLMVALSAVSAYVTDPANLTRENWTRAWKLFHRAVNKEGLATDVVTVSAKSLSRIWSDQFMHPEKYKGVDLTMDIEELKPFFEIVNAAGA